MQSASKKRHEDFVREIRSPLSPTPKTIRIVPLEEETCPEEEDIQAALEAKFDELFGALSEDVE